MKKIIKNKLREALGVPDGILDVAKTLYNDLISSFMNNDAHENNGKMVNSFNFIGDFVISDFKFRKVLLDVEVTETDQETQPKIYSLTFSADAARNNSKGVFIGERRDYVVISISIAAPIGYTQVDIFELLKRENHKLLNSLSHELKHAYDNQKNNISKMTDRSEYTVANKSRFGIKPIDLFLHNSYYIHNVENLVRPSEFAMSIESEGISKTDFIKFLTTNDVYIKLKMINNFSFEGLKSELLSDVDNIKEKLRNTDIDMNGTDEYVVDYLLIQIFRILKEKKIGNLEMYLNGGMSFFFNFSDREDSKILDDYKKELNKCKNYQEFFRIEEQKFKQTSLKMLKKITKLYDMAKTDKKVEDIINKIHSKSVNTTNESIIDWDAYYNAEKIPVIEITNKK